MTIIAAIATDDRVVMGCDTAVDYSGTAIYRAHGKIGTLHTAKGEKILLAASGAAHMLPLIMRNLKVTDTPDAADPAAADEWADAVAEAITDILASASPSLLTAADGGSAASIEGTLVMAWRQHLWWLYTALGAKPEDAMDLAVRLACRHASGCSIDDRGPMLHSTKAD